MDMRQRELNRLFDSAFGRGFVSTPGTPPINIWTSEDSQVIRAEMPGFDPADIDIRVSADQFVLSGEWKRDGSEKDTEYHRRERSIGKFSRSIQLPFMVDPDSVDVTYKNGILEVKLQRAEADKPKKIAVKSG
jgi:HSP20 family protein